MIPRAFAETAAPSVAIVVPSFDRGGLEQVALNLYRGYKARGCRCTVLVERNEAGFMLGRLDDPRDAVILNGEARIFLEALADRQVDVLHYHYSTFGLPEARDFGIFTLYTIHNAYTWLDDAAFAHHAGRVMLADRVVAVSRFVRDYFQRRAAADPARIDVVPNGIDLGWIDSTRPPPALDIPEDRFVFALPASYFPVKHHPLALRAAERLAERRRDFQLVFLGNVGDPDYAEHVDALVEASSARAHVSRIPCLAHKDMAGFYRDRADCVLLPTIQEGCSNVVLEALAFDKPMILTDVGNAREASAMSARIRLIDPPEETDSLTPARLQELGRRGDTRNLCQLVDAMSAVLAVRGGAASEADLAERRRAIGLDRMVDAYHRLFREAAPLAPQSEGARPSVPARAMPSYTSETLP